MTSSTFARRFAAVFVMTVAAATISVPASAHAALVSSDPEDGATVTELTTVRLEFSEDLIEVGNRIVVTDGAGEVHELETSIAEDNVLEGEVPQIAPGAIEIAWRSASVDGHTEEGTLSVTLVAPEPSVSPSPIVTVTATATPTPSPSVTPSASPSAEPEPASGGVNPWLVGLLGLVVIGGTGAAIIAATRRPPYED